MGAERTATSFQPSAGSCASCLRVFMTGKHREVTEERLETRWTTVCLVLHPLSVCEPGEELPALLTDGRHCVVQVQADRTGAVIPSPWNLFYVRRFIYCGHSVETQRI